jgi:hypothetical protein
MERMFIGTIYDCSLCDAAASHLLSMTCLCILACLPVYILLMCRRHSACCLICSAGMASKLWAHAMLPCMCCVPLCISVKHQKQAGRREEGETEGKKEEGVLLFPLGSILLLAKNMSAISVR